MPTTGGALLITVAFLLPGFVTVLLQERTFKHADDPTPLDRLLRILYYSVWSYLLLAVLALLLNIDLADVKAWYHDLKNDPAEIVWRGALLILLPSLAIASATRFWQGSRPQAKFLRVARINERHEQPTAWDFFFRQRHDAYLRITLSDGGAVHGYYGANSFAAYSKHGADLYLERVYAKAPGNWFGQEAVNHHGVWVKGEEIVAIEFYDPWDADTEEAEPEPTPKRPWWKRSRSRRAPSADRSQPPSSATTADAASSEG
jgi:hypothetical protein